MRRQGFGSSDALVPRNSEKRVRACRQPSAAGVAHDHVVAPALERDPAHARVLRQRDLHRAGGGAGLRRCARRGQGGGQQGGHGEGEEAARGSGCQDIHVRAQCRDGPVEAARHSNVCLVAVRQTVQAPSTRRISASAARPTSSCSARGLAGAHHALDLVARAGAARATPRCPRGARTRRTPRPPPRRCPAPRPPRPRARAGPPGAPPRCPRRRRPASAPPGSSRSGRAPCRPSAASPSCS